MTLLGFKTILHKKCRSGKNSEAPAEKSSAMKTNFKKSGNDVRFVLDQCTSIIFSNWPLDVVKIPSQQSEILFMYAEYSP